MLFGRYAAETSSQLVRQIISKIIEPIPINTLKVDNTKVITTLLE